MITYSTLIKITKNCDIIFQQIDIFIYNTPKSNLTLTILIAFIKLYWFECIQFLGALWLLDFDTLALFLICLVQ